MASRPKVTFRHGWCNGGIALFVFSLAAFLFIQPQYQQGEYLFQNDSEWKTFSMPLEISEGQSNVQVKIPFTLRAVYPSRFHVIPDDCVDSISVNGEHVVSEKIPFCDYAKGRTIALGSYLHEGANELVLTVRNTGGPGSLSVRVSPVDPLALVFLLFMLAGFGMFLYGLTPLAKYVPWMNGTVHILFLGIALRIYYFFVTPYSVRGHDVDGHIEYIQHLLEHGALPRIGEGWESYQPPLYYVLSALWMWCGDLFGRGRELLLRDIQLSALLISIITFVLACWMGSLFFAKRKDAPILKIYLLLLAVFPSWIFFAARINNDVLLQLWLFLGLVFFLLWWNTHKEGWWIATVIAIALGILTKTSAALLLVPLAVCSLFYTRWSAHEKARMAFIGIILLVILTGWFGYMRIVGDNQRSIVGNVGNLHSGLRVDRSLESLTEFNPVRVVRNPYNNPWSDASGRNNFWEYYVKSAFFGEFDFGEKRRLLAMNILLTALLLIIPMIAGIYLSLKKDTHWAIPLGILTISWLAGHVLFRELTPYSSSQDFRYSILLVVPLAYFVARGIQSMSTTLQTVFVWCTYLFAASAIGFILSLSVTV